MISTALKWITGILEGLLAIPIVGGLFILGSGWQALLFMFIFHAVTLGFSIKDGRFSVGSVIGMVANLLGVIPILGWMLHTLTAIVLVIDAAVSSASRKRD
ncbi:hypothetical protein [Thalassobacillus hwangdonensis]|uniref:Uncharacterized protein n=1 Tax=Thalassobacillus hwangdonensis TaxID=546108 RepID=A0ABW3L5N6_9BACI